MIGPRTYEEWRKKITTTGRNHLHWQYAGDWFFPTPLNDNEMWKGKFYHICEENWRLGNDDTSKTVEACTDSCCECGEEIPEGIKMIAALLTW